MVRRSVGYFRYDTRRELDLLNQLRPLASLQVNLSLPQQRLIAKTRTGAIARKRHDTATAPVRRRLDRYPDLVDPHDRRQLEAQLETADLLALRHQITDTRPTTSNWPAAEAPPSQGQYWRRLTQPPEDDPTQTGTTR